MALEIQAAKSEQVGEFRSVLGRAFGWEAPEERTEAFLSVWEPERSFCAFDEGTMVGTSGAYSLEMTTPGGVIAVGGTTMISVLPTHRRRGVLNSMMEAHLRDVAERGEPMAALWASDSAIYGRFGYGPASLHFEVKVDPRHAAFHRLAPEPATVRLLDQGPARDAIPKIHDQIRTGRAGFFRRSDAWWETRWFSDHSSLRDDATSLRFGLVEDASGYIIYRQKSHWDEGHGTGEVRVLDLMASTPEGWAGLWRLALTHDLVTNVTADLRATDDPIFDLLAARRRVVGRVSDALWVRLMDLPTALAGRRYQTDGRLVLEVLDRYLDRKSVVELISEDGASHCQPSTADPDVSLDLEDLSACFMGRAQFRALAALGRVHGMPEATTRADLMFGWESQPWCPEIF
ncbi:MAG TPA: GNAT family N-acetyltransferase [Acidimicrobiia bacterium]|nr:GNAT family N-acetyltransferase [Acidimicrobiia bacterium]